MKKIHRPAFPFDGVLKVGIIFVLVAVFGNFPQIGFFSTGIIFAIFGVLFVCLPEYLSTKYIISGDVVLIRSLYWKREFKLSEIQVSKFKLDKEIKGGVRSTLFFLDSLELKGIKTQLCVSYQKGNSIMIRHQAEQVIVTPKNFEGFLKDLEYVSRAY